jgi:hypothetical protein
MLRGLLMTLTLCLTGAICAPTEAAAVRFAGTLAHVGLGVGTFDGATAVLDAGWASTASLTTGLNFFALNVNNTTLFLGGPSGNIAFQTYDAPNPLKDRVRVTNAGPILANGSTLTNTNLFLNSSTTLGGGVAVNATQTNWDQIYAAMNTVNSGNLGVRGQVTIDGEAYQFTGAAVPEPGSIALLSGLGLVFGAVRRRRQTRATAV